MSPEAVAPPHPEKAVAGDKPRVFALVPKTISVPFYNDVERGCSDEAKKIGVQGKFTGPTTAGAAQQVQVLQDWLAKGWTASRSRQWTRIP